MTASFKTNAGWQKLGRALDPKMFGPILERHIEKAINELALTMQSRIRAKVRSGAFEKNAELTLAIKQSTKPLVDQGDLFQAVTVERISKMAAFVGVKKTAEQFHIVKGIHDGVSIRVTDKMRAMFWALWLVSIGNMPVDELKGRARALYDRKPRDWRPLKDTTTAIVIPPRPFIRETFEDHGTKSVVGKRLARAVREAVKEATATSGGGGALP